MVTVSLVSFLIVSSFMMQIMFLCCPRKYIHFEHLTTNFSSLLLSIQCLDFHDGIVREVERLFQLGVE